MPRISTYDFDPGLNGQDRLVGSSYEGFDVHGPIYATKTYTLSQLANYFAGFITDGAGGAIDLVELANNVDNNTQAIASANQSITVIANDQLAQSTFQTNLASSFGTYDEDGNLTSLSQAFADQVLQTTASDRYANAQFVTNLAASTGTYDENGNLLTMAEAFANQVLQVTTTDRFATAEFATNLASSFGTYNPDGSIATFSQSFADQVLSTANTAEFAESSFVTNLASSFGTYDSNGNLLTISSSFADDVLSTANTAEFAQASKLTALGASFGTVNPDGSVSFSNTSTYSNEILNYVDSNSALATQVATLETTVTNIPVTVRQPEPPDVNAYPLGSIWVDTDDSNAIYILVDGTPRTWQPTTSEALGDLILSNAQLQDEVNLISTNLSSEATKLTTLTAQFGVYDPATDTFTINNNAAVTSALRSYADAESAAASKVDGINSVFNIVDANGNVIKNLATFNQEITTYVDENSATAQSISELQTEVEGNSNTISVQQDSIDGIEGRYGVTIDQNGNVAGFQLLNGTGGSEFKVSVDSFKIFNNTTDAEVFVVDPEGVKLNIPLNGVSGTFTGTLNVGDVFIGGDDIKITGSSTSSALAFFQDGNATKKAAIFATDLSGAGNIVMSSGAGEVVMVSNAGLGSQIVLGNNETIEMRAGFSEISLGSSSMTVNRNVIAPDFVLSSDRSLKENIEDYVAKPININYKSYNLIGSEEKRVGVIAQELEVEHPEFVRENEEGVKSVSYIDMLVAKVAELEARIKELENGNTK
jgi:hypothetical protein